MRFPKECYWKRSFNYQSHTSLLQLN